MRSFALIVIFFFLVSKIEAEEIDEASQHWLYKVIPSSREQINWYNIPKWFTWALLGNDDDGIFGEKPSANFKTDLPIGFRRAMSWTARNPLHNFNFYVIGSAHRQNSEFVLIQLSKEKVSFFEYRRKATTVFAGRGTSFYLGFHGWKPFISLRIDYGRLLDFYIGWRERGNFGIKFLPAKRKKHRIAHAKEV